MRQKVIVDCDNTMGVQGRDIDDGLALFYLLGSKDVELLGVSTTFGNSDVDTVYQVTQQLFEEFNLHDLPLVKGIEKSEVMGEAAYFLAETAAKYPGEITLLATGSLTNLFQASLVDVHFFSNLKQIVLMGGITEPLMINGKRLGELNFSSDPIAAYHVLRAQTKVTTMTGNLCLQAFFGKEQVNFLNQYQDTGSYSYLLGKIRPWIQHMDKEFGLNGFYNWDTTAAVYITHPELFKDYHCVTTGTKEHLKTGNIKPAKLSRNGSEINIPTSIVNVPLFNQTILEAWKNIDIVINTHN
ncbi:nucleoside hydrolase [Radiobacillus kanasensis]|uniref:nucleoside hydrolase n=1 Tax=Radiobacillus kanasensis TaxID=2844358 RepID=UPI001E4105B7|nr:nucleoside hydrolase [Radiobacillus kanasensis]UFT98633.1 nucleoside hydrolase [Radiobacillus kanasensis]